MKSIDLLNVLLLAPLFSGCVYEMSQSNSPGSEKLYIADTKRGAWSIEMENHSTTLVPPDGKVTVEVPRLPRGCSVYFLGFIQVRDGSPKNAPVIHLFRDGKVVRKLSLRTLHKLPVDKTGFRELRF